MCESKIIIENKLVDPLEFAKTKYNVICSDRQGMERTLLTGIDLKGKIISTQLEEKKDRTNQIYEYILILKVSQE